MKSWRQQADIGQAQTTNERVGRLRKWRAAEKQTTADEGDWQVQSEAKERAEVIEKKNAKNGAATG